MNRPSWDDTFLKVLSDIAQRSRDPRTKVGAVIVDCNNSIVSVGYNSPPRYFDDSKPYIYEVPAKYRYFEHAERNAIYNALNNGAHMISPRIYISWLPCADCARAIIQVGIIEVVVTTFSVAPRWVESIDAGLDMMCSAGIKLRLPNDDTNWMTYSYKSLEENYQLIKLGIKQETCFES